MIQLQELVKHSVLMDVTEIGKTLAFINKSNNII